MDIIFNSILVTFISLFLICLAIAATVGYLINKASDLGGPGFLSTDLHDQDLDLSAFPAESSTEVGLQSSAGRSRVTWDFDGRSSNAVKTLLEGSGAPAVKLPAGSACQFCGFVRERVRNAWNRV